MKRHEKLIRKAVKVAQQSTYRWKHGAVVAKGNKVLGCAPNKKRNFSAFNYPGDHYTDHAERATLRELLKVRDDLRGCTIYIARINKDEKTMMSRPCVWCMWAIHAAGIKEIVYTNEMGSYSVEKVEFAGQPLI